MLALELSLPVLIGSGLLWYGTHATAERPHNWGPIVTACSLGCSAVVTVLSVWSIYLLWLRSGLYTGAVQPALSAVSVGTGFGAVLGHVYVERSHHYRENERLSHAVDASMDGIAIVEDDRYSYVNDAYASLYEFRDSAELDGRRWDTLYTNASRACIERTVVPALADRHYWRGTLTGKRIDGTTFPLDVTVSSFEAGYVVVARDISEQRDREQRIQVLNRVLRHNLRNSFTVIRGHATLVGEQNPDLKERHVAPILEEIDDLVATADKARGVERTLDQRGQADVIDATDAVRSAVDRATAAYPDARIVSEIEETGSAVPTVDSSIIDALNELVDNAVEHYENGEDGSTAPTIELAVRTITYETESRLEFTVTDNGVGIPEAERRAVAAGQETQLDHGSGLGLWLVTWIVKNAGGDLRFADAPDDGTIVTLSFPYEAATVSESAAAPLLQ